MFAGGEWCGWQFGGLPLALGSGGVVEVEVGESQSN